MNITLIKRFNYPNGISEEYELHIEASDKKKNKKIIENIFGTAYSLPLDNNNKKTLLIK